MTAATIGLVVAFLSLPAAGAAPLFQRIDSQSSGLDFQNRFDEDGDRSYLYQSGFACGAVVIGDVDGDRRPDVFFCGGAGENALFLNRGGLKFERSPSGASLAGGANWASGAAFADLDNDGDLDLLVCNYAAPNQLFLNSGAGEFTEVTAASGLGVAGPSLEPLVADFDRDGDLDLFLLNNKLYLPEGRPQRPPYKMVDGKPVVDDSYAPYLHILPKGDGNFSIDGYGQPDRLLINDGVGDDGVPKFRDVTAASGIAGIGHGLSATLVDVDADGWLDIFVANDFLVPDRLWKNLGPGKDGVPRFSDAVTHFFPQIAWSSMGSAAGDLDDDGYTDLMVVDMAATTHLKAKISMGEMKGRMREVLETGWPRQAMRNHVFFGTGTPRYQELAWFSGLASTDWSWAVKLADFDLDGRLDIFLTNGHTRNFSDADVPFSTAALIGRTQFDIYRDSGRLLEENLAFRNAGARRFEKAPDWGLGHEGMSYAAATGDLDADGDPDLIVANLGEEIHLYRNDASGGNRFSVRLEGTRSNRFAIGAKVVVTDSTGARRTRWVNPQNGFLSQDDTALLFGLGDARPVSIEVDWPSGIRQIAKIGADKTELTLAEKGKITPRKQAPASRFVASVAPAFTHRERPFDDFARQPLLPGKLSQLGPCLAAGDFDGDGDADLFAGGAAGQSSALFL
ncbi:MAG: CRTAC1 family protein, partial [Verrucomicrobiales bacterium]